MDMENTFAKKVQKAMGSAIPDWIPRGKWRGVSYGHILTDMRNNFIDGYYPVKCCIKGNLSEGEIKYHQGASHLNSSQVMCINFFKKFFEPYLHEYSRKKRNYGSCISGGTSDWFHECKCSD